MLYLMQWVDLLAANPWYVPSRITSHNHWIMTRISNAVCLGCIGLNYDLLVFRIFMNASHIIPFVVQTVLCESMICSKDIMIIRNKDPERPRCRYFFEKLYSMSYSALNHFVISLLLPLENVILQMSTWKQKQLLYSYTWNVWEPLRSIKKLIRRI
jgi:hypothetical protein